MMMNALPHDDFWILVPERMAGGVLGEALMPLCV